MNRKQILNMMTDEEKAVMKFSFETEGIVSTSRIYKITYSQGVGIAKDMNIVFDKYKLNQRKTKDLSKFLDNERRLKISGKKTETV